MPDTKQIIPYDSIYMKFKNRHQSSVVNRNQHSDTVGSGGGGGRGGEGRERVLMGTDRRWKCCVSGLGCGL